MNLDQDNNRTMKSNPFEMFFEKFFKGFFMFLFFVAFLFLFAAAFMWLWNALLPELFGLPIITYWQGLGLLALSKILFTGFGGGGWRHRSNRSWRHMDHSDKAAYRDRMKAYCKSGSWEDPTDYKEVKGDFND